YSAAKVTGRRAYDLARSGHDVTLEPRRGPRYGSDVLGDAVPPPGLSVPCGEGKYIPSLARDPGGPLGCGALVETLRRTRVGSFLGDGALSPDADARVAREKLLPVASAVVGLPRVELDPVSVARLRQGQSIRFREPGPPPESGSMVAVF